MVLRERGALWALTFSLDDFMVLREREREVGENVVEKHESVSQPKKKGRCGSPYIERRWGDSQKKKTETGVVHGLW